MRLLLEKTQDVSEKNQALFAVMRSGVAIVVAIAREESEGAAKPTPTPAHSPWYEITRLLLDKGAEVDARDEENSTPLLEAAAHGQTELFELLLEHNSDIGARDKYGNTALIAAACECAAATMPSTYGIVLKLLDLGADVNAKTNDGTTALMNAAGGFGSADIAELLIARGANVSGRNKKGETALTLAIKSGRPDKIRLMRKAIGQTH